MRVDELLIRAPEEADVELIAPAFVDPEVGGEAGLPPVGPEALLAFMREQMPPMRAQGLLAAYVIADADGDDPGRARRCTTSTRCATRSRSATGCSARRAGAASRRARSARSSTTRSTTGSAASRRTCGSATRASERVLERLGFEREGVRRKFLRHEGRRVDATIFARLADDA